jgi:hypothetical protein
MSQQILITGRIKRFERKHIGKLSITKWVGGGGKISSKMFAKKSVRIILFTPKN